MKLVDCAVQSSGCKGEVLVSDDAIGGICWWCFMLQGRRQKREKENQVIDADKFEQAVQRGGKALEDFRKDHNLTLKELAKLVGKSESYVSLIENGKRLPTTRIISLMKRQILKKMQSKIIQQVTLIL